MCVPVCGFKLWIYLTIDLKACTSIYLFKKTYEDKIIRQCEVDRLVP